MTKHNCGNCRFRANYDAKPESIPGRLWRWHINICPGWKRYFSSLPQEEKTELADKYNFHKYQ